MPDLCPESPLRQVLLRHGVSPALQEVARRTLTQQAASSPYAYRKTILMIALLAAGVYLILAVGGAGDQPLLALAIGSLVVLAPKVLQRSGLRHARGECEWLFAHTRSHVDFVQLSRDLHALDASLAADLRPVLLAGVAAPTDLSDYSILHLWECIRRRAQEWEQQAVRPAY